MDNELLELQKMLETSELQLREIGDLPTELEPIEFPDLTVDISIFDMSENQNQDFEHMLAELENFDFEL